MSFFKRCPSCGSDKDLSEFARDPNRVDGLTRCCKKCRGTDDDEVLFSIYIETQGDISTRGFQITRECIENLDVGHLIYILESLMSRGLMSEQQLNLLFDFGQMLVLAKADID